jgi:GNAT superfamily N-acetyltransferase
MAFLTELLNAYHQKADFSCGNELLDRYLRHQASQDVRRKLSACFVCLAPESPVINGYYTLSAHSIPLKSLPTDSQSPLPKHYTAIPVSLLGRLAIDQSFQGQGLGALLLVDALKRCVETSYKLGSFAVVVDPVNQEATAFYAKFGFVELPDSKRMFLSMKTVEKLF